MRSPEEERRTQQFEAQYATGQSPLMRTIERRVCGCDYGASSWTTRTEAEDLVVRLGLRRGLRLLDVGAGAGWPGLYLSAESGCDVVLVDLPFLGLKTAADRSRRSGTGARTSYVLADAACLPFRDASFDAISHSDLLCCLRPKKAVLEACRRVISRLGRMVFTVISVAPNLSATQHRRAVVSGPEFVESDADCADLLEQTGWVVTARENITADFAASCRRQLDADERHEAELAVLLGTVELGERMLGWKRKIAAVTDGLLERELFEALPA